MSAHNPHRQLKTIRKRLGITQKTAARMLGVSYPYLLSIETGQRDLSGPLAGRIARTFGVNRIFEKDKDPFIRDGKGNLVPFTKELYEQYRTRQPSYYIEDEERVVRPTAAQYAQCTQALFEAAQQQ